LADFSSIRQFANEVKNFSTSENATVKNIGISFLINNAGVGFGANKSEYFRTKNGLEEIVGVNHFGHFLLTKELLDSLKKFGNNKDNASINPDKKKARIVAISSSLHNHNIRMGRVNPYSIYINNQDGAQLDKFSLQIQFNMYNCSKYVIRQINYAPS